MKHAFLALAFGVAAAMVMAAAASAPPADDTALIETQFARWDAALEGRDPATVAALFAPDGVLLQTV